jgi:2-C-methyl-D-erythritol 4-phosphate cytidylyltransferase
VQTALILPAAGRGERFGGFLPKQLQPIAGAPLFIHALRPFHHLVTEVVLVVSDDWRDRLRAAVDAFLPGWPLRLVAGGANRQASVAAGLAALSPDCEVALVHDAARPLIEPAAIRACIQALRRYPACVLAAPCTDTLKRSHGPHDRLVRATEKREHFWRAETPQGFRVALARQAYAGIDRACTDDSHVVELAGASVHIVASAAANPKLTTAADRAFIDWCLRQRCPRGVVPLAW